MKKPNVRYYPVILRILTPETVLYRAAVISSSAELTADNFPQQTIVERFLLKYRGPRWEGEYSYAATFSRRVEVIDSTRRNIWEWLRKKLREKNENQHGYAVELSLDLRKPQVVHMGDWEVNFVS